MSQIEQDSEIFHSGMSFDEFQLPSDLVADLFDAHFDEATLMQKQSIPAIITPPYKSLLAQGQNRTGKTLSCVTGMLARIDRNDPNLQSVYLLPHRELAIQTYNNYILKLTNHYKVNTALFIRDPPVQSDITKAQLIVSTPFQFQRLVNSDFDLSTIKILAIDDVEMVLANATFRKVFELLFIKPMKNKIQILLFSSIVTENVHNFIRKHIEPENLNQIKVEIEELYLSS